MEAMPESIKPYSGPCANVPDLPHHSLFQIQVRRSVILPRPPVIRRQVVSGKGWRASVSALIRPFSRQKLSLNLRDSETEGLPSPKFRGRYMLSSWQGGREQGRPLHV